MQLLHCIEDNLKQKAKNPCIILRDHIDVKNQLTYKEVDNIQNRIYDFIFVNVKKFSHFALVMKHNIYIPSIIIRYIFF